MESGRSVPKNLIKGSMLTFTRCVVKAELLSPPLDDSPSGGTRLVLGELNISLESVIQKGKEKNCIVRPFLRDSHGNTQVVLGTERVAYAYDNIKELSNAELVGLKDRVHEEIRSRKEGETNNG